MDTPLCLNSQTGSTLIISLVVLSILSLIVLSGVATGTLQERMAGNYRDRSVAFQAAEAALRIAEGEINGGTAPFEPFEEGQFTAGCHGGLCRSQPAAPKWSAMSDADWADNTKTRTVTDVSILAGVAQVPRYVIEYQGTTQPIQPNGPCEVLFLVTARASGARGDTVVLLQTQHRHRAGLCQPTV